MSYRHILHLFSLLYYVPRLCSSKTIFRHFPYIFFYDIVWVITKQKIKKIIWHVLYCANKLFLLQSLPDKNLIDLSQVCRTFSLATLKNIFPPSSHFTKGGNTSNISPSGYVAEYIGKIYLFIFMLNNEFIR